MKATAWGWRPVRPEGIWRHGCRWARPLTVAAPGLVLNLPAPVCGKAATPGLAAIVVPVVREGAAGRETLVFFDDARYSLSDAASAEAFRARLAARAQADRSGTFLLLADGRVAAGELMRLMALARDAGVARVEIGERRE